MHSDQYSNRYVPTSPLSPKLATNNRPISPQPHRARGSHLRQTSRNMQTSLPRYHPANFGIQDTAMATAPAAVPSPAITINRAPAPTQLESPRLMRDRQRELLDRALMSSKIAASPLGIRPDSPRLNPLGSPNGIVTPLALEEASDYFAVTAAGRLSPATSPGRRSPRSPLSPRLDLASGQGEKIRKNNKRKVDMY